MNVIEKILLTSLLIFSLLFPISALSKDVYVNSYTRSDGTHVKGHYRSAPDNTINNNFSTQGNVNPYTGKRGWVPRENDSYEMKSSSGWVMNDGYNSGGVNLGLNYGNMKCETELITEMCNSSFVIKNPSSKELCSLSCDDKSN
jgi:hypothetical protein